jgi:anaerobic selenocysteine-containing dehydrogenase
MDRDAMELAMKHYRSCNLCEAICGLEIETDDRRILTVQGDKKDPLSRGHICPKALALKDIHEDPDRLKTPVKRTESGWVELSWEQAYGEIAQRLGEIRDAHGNDALAVYFGNPTAHSLGALLFKRLLVEALDTPNVFTASSVDQLPHHFAASFMFGHSLLLPVPDIDRSAHVLMLGANPLASNGSLMTAPGIGARLKALRERGGKLVLVDPRRSETARFAGEHHFIRPGADVFLLAAMLNIIFREGLQRPGRLEPAMDGLAELQQAVAEVTPELAASLSGIAAADIERMAREFAAAEAAVCYGRMGTSTQAHGGLCQWLINTLNAVTGNLDHPGGAMFTRPAVAIRGKRGTRDNFDRWQSRIRGLPEFDGELPVSAMAEDMLVEGRDRIRALITHAGNPVLSTPNGRQMEAALEKLDFMVAIDIYRNETTRHAHIILPPATGVECDHYDLVFNTLAVRNVAKYSPPLFPLSAQQRHDWQIFENLARRLDAAAESLPARLGQSLLRSLIRRLPPTRMLAIGLAMGPHGFWRRFRPGGSPRLTLGRLKRSPHGIDLGPLTPQLPDALRLPGKRLDLAPALFVGRLRQVLAEAEKDGDAPQSLRLIGRRHVRDNNSWLHNSLRLVKGRNRCTLLMHPDDAGRLGLSDRQRVRVISGVGAIELPLEIGDSIMPGVVSIPHGYGHTRPGARIPVAEAHAGVSVNDITDHRAVDELTCNLAFSGQPVRVEPV